MKVVLENEVIDVNKEIKHMIDYISLTWECVSQKNISDLVEHVFNAGLLAGKNWINPHAGFDISKEASDRRRANFFNQKVLVYDGIDNFIVKMLFSPKSFFDIVLTNWDYEDEVNKIVKEVNNIFSDSKKILPKEYNKNKKFYMERKDINDTNSIDFAGVNSEGAGNFGFHKKITCSNVLFDDIDQGRKPFNVLISAIFSHALFVAQHNNTANFILELENIYQDFDNYSKDKPIYFEPKTDNLFINVFCFYYKLKFQDSLDAQSQEELDKYIENLSNQPIIHSNENIHELVSRLIDEILKEENSIKYKQKEMEIINIVLDFVENYNIETKKKNKI